jgi:predicted site-specific integrase-resolvase
MPVTAEQIWLKTKPAADRLGVTVYTLHNMALSGLIRTKTDPGSLPRFHAEDIDKLREESATATG